MIILSQYEINANGIIGYRVQGELETMEDKDKLYNCIQDNFNGIQKNKMNIDPKTLNEIEEAPRKIKRLLKNLKEENKIAEYEMCEDGTVTVEITAIQPPSSIPADILIITPEKIHQKVMNAFLDDHIKSIENDETALKKYSDLFRFFVRIQPTDSKDEQIGNLFDFVADKVNNMQDEYILKIIGPDGTGKSTFLSLLYLYLHRLYCTQKLSVYPYYINLHQYEKRISEIQNTAEPNNIVKEWIKEDFECLGEYTNSDTNFLLIVDGNDRYNRTNVKICTNFLKVLNRIPKYKKIICISEKTNVHLNKARTNEECIDYKTAYTFDFSPIFITERDRWESVVRKFCNIFRCTKQEETIIKCIDEFHIKEIDYNLLTIFYRISQRMELEKIHCVHELYNRYCYYYLNEIEKLDGSIHLAYTYFMTNETIMLRDISSKWLEWELIHQHKTISNYLLALYYSKIIESGNDEGIEEFECVFSYGINFFLKSIIREKEGLQENTIEFCEKIFEKGTFMAKCQAAYMLGRITDPNIQERARKLLRDQDNLCKPEDAKNEDKRQQYFLKRSILVSRLYLKEITAGEAMLKELFSSPIMSEVNRAFFVQYNADVSMGHKTVNLYDNGNNKIPYTVKGLFNYVYKSLKISSFMWDQKDRYQFQIHLFTLCSLIQQRMNLNKKEYQK